MTGELLINPEYFLILVVDDIPANLKVMKEILEPVGYSLTFARSGVQVIERVKLAKPDLILLDLMMPEMDGLQVCQALKSEPDTQNIPIIFITASHEEDHLIQAFEFGAVDYVTKPFRKPELLARVRTHLLLKYTLDELRQTQTELQQALQEVEKLARLDPLTGIFNRRILMEKAHQEMERAKRYGTPFSVLLLDVDHFKRVNDTYGHPVGDQALCAVVETILDSIRKVDFVGRYGGEEFAIILPEITADSALKAAERIRLQIANLSVPTEEGMLKLTVSIGVTTYHPEDSIIDQLFKRADQGLYQAKAQGRNQCCQV
ncbi:MAG: PleD family two-component system response regulator [Lyngbya sp.]|nr:PleD family two-component system response regulator [Lyngbya sp.]